MKKLFGFMKFFVALIIIILFVTTIFAGNVSTWSLHRGSSRSEVPNVQSDANQNFLFYTADGQLITGRKIVYSATVEGSVLSSISGSQRQYSCSIFSGSSLSI